MILDIKDSCLIHFIPVFIYIHYICDLHLQFTIYIYNLYLQFTFTIYIYNLHLHLLFTIYDLRFTIYSMEIAAG